MILTYIIWYVGNSDKMRCIIFFCKFLLIFVFREDYCRGVRSGTSQNE